MTKKPQNDWEKKYDREFGQKTDQIDFETFCDIKVFIKQQIKEILAEAIRNQSI